MVLLKTGDLARRLLSRLLLEDLGELSRLFVVGHVLELEGLLSSTKQSIDLETLLGQLGSGTDEALLATKLAKRSTTDALNLVLERGVGDTRDDGLDVFVLVLLGNAMLLDDKSSGLLDGVPDDVVQLLVSKNLVDVLNLVLVAVVGGSGVRGIDGEKLALNVGLKVVNIVDTLDFRLVATVLEGLLLDAPLKELLDLDVHAGICVLVGHNTVNSRIGVSGTLLDVVESGCIELVLDVGFDETLPGSCGVDHVLASNDSKRR